MGLLYRAQNIQILANGLLEDAKPRDGVDAMNIVYTPDPG
jgi:hypothetical protein